MIFLAIGILYIKSHSMVIAFGQAGSGPPGGPPVAAGAATAGGRARQRRRQRRALRGLRQPALLRGAPGGNDPGMG